MLLLGLRQQLAAPFTGELAAHMWVQVHVTHLLSVPLMDGRASAPCGHAGGMPARAVARPARMPVRADDHGQVQLTGRSQRRATGQDEYFAEGRPLVAELTLTRPIPERRATPGKLHQIRWADRYP
jgi:hypothetical protein